MIHILIIMPTKQVNIMFCIDILKIHQSRQQATNHNLINTKVRYL